MNTQMSTQGSSTPPSGGGMTTTAAGTDNLTSQIAGMSKHQLYQIVSQMKDLIQQNQQQARQILIANPQLTKTLFQAQIMLGMVRAPDTLPPVALAATQPPAAMALAQPSQQSPARTPPLQVPPTPPPQPIGTFQPLSSPQPAASQQPPPQMTSPYLQQSQTASVSLQANEPSFSFQHSMQMQTPSHSLPAAALQPLPQPPLPSHPPPLPQQPRPLAPPSQVQQQNTQGMSFVTPPAPQSYHPHPPYMQQGGLSPQANVGPSFQQMHAPPLPSQPPPQHMLQVPRDMGGNASTSSGGMLPVGGTESGRGLNMGVPSTSASLMTWNQALPSTGPMGVPQVTPTGHLVPGQPPFVGSVGLTSSMAPGPGLSQTQVFNQPLTQPQPSLHQPQMQMPMELEQQKALLQQVMNLTPEQINLLPPEQRQQVLQLQQAFRSQTG